MEMPISAPKPELLAVDEAGGGVDEDRGGVDLADEAVGGPQVVGDDRLAVAAAVAGDVGDGGVEGVDHPHRQLQVEELGGVVVVGGDGRHPVAEDLAGGLVADQLDALEPRGHLAEERGGDVAVHEQRLGGVAHRRALGLGVLDDRGGHGEVGGGVDVDVAVAVAVDHVGHGGVLEDRADQRRAAPRDEHVDRLAEAHELDRRLVAGVLDEHERVVRAARPWPGPRAARRRWRCSSGWRPTSRGGTRRCRTSGTARTASLVTLGRFS